MGTQAGNRPHRIVIVGGGAGGLELATRLGDTLGRRGKADVTLIDRTADSIVLAAGVQPGERVVTAGVNSLKPGQKVTFDEDAQ